MQHNGQHRQFSDHHNQINYQHIQSPHMANPLASPPITPQYDMGPGVPPMTPGDQHQSWGNSPPPCYTPLGGGFGLPQTPISPRFGRRLPSMAGMTSPSFTSPPQNMPHNMHNINTIPDLLPITPTISNQSAAPPLIDRVNDQHGNHVYVCNKGVVVGKRKKRYVRLRWGDGTKGHKARWVGFAPTSWTFSSNRPVPNDPLLLGFFVKPNLCENRTKSKKAGTGWVTLSIDCDRRAVKATLDGWTLGKVYIPTWLLGRVMRPVAVSEHGTAIQFDLKTELGCEKVLRAGFRPWDSITNQEIQKLRCSRTGVNFVNDVLGMNLHVCLDENSNVVRVMGLDSGYVSYTAIEAGFIKPNQEVIPLVINDHHAFRVKERKLWDLFYADERVPLDYLSERMNALILKIYEARQRRDKRTMTNCLTKLCHLRHILYYLAKESYEVVADANARVKWFTGNNGGSGSHRQFTPNLGKLLICLAVSDYEWEDIAVPFVLEMLHRAVPHAMTHSTDFLTTDLDSSFHSIMSAEPIAAMIVYTKILKTILKPNFEDLDSITLERLSAEELCCGVAGLSSEFQILEYERSSRKDEIKKSIIRRDWENEFNAEQWEIIQGVLDDPVRLRAMLCRARMMSHLHGSCGLPTYDMKMDIERAHDDSKSVRSWKEMLAHFDIEYPGNSLMPEVLARCVRMSQLKGYLRKDFPLGRVVTKACARELVGLNQGPRGLELLRRQNREEPTWEPEVVPELKTREDNDLPSDCGSVEVKNAPAPERVIRPVGEPTRSHAPEIPPRISIPSFKGQANNFSARVGSTSPTPQPHYSPHGFVDSPHGGSPGYAPAAYLFNPAMYPMVVTPRLNNMPGTLSPPPMSQHMIFPNPSSNRSVNSVDGKQEAPDISEFAKHNSGRFQDAFEKHSRQNPRGPGNIGYSQTQVPDVVPMEAGSNTGQDQTPRGQFLGKFSFARNSLPPNGSHQP